MNEYYMGQNSNIRIAPDGDTGITISIRTPDKTINLMLSIDVASNISKEINRVVEILCKGARDD